MREAINLQNELNPAIVGDYTQIFAVARKTQVDRIIVALDERRGKFPLEELLFCRLKGFKVDDGVTFSEELAGKLSVENLYPSVLIFSDGFKRSAIFSMFKRCVDILVSIFCLAIFSPICLLIAIAIKLDSKGPILYRQQRVGEDAKVFSLLKFRSMKVNAEENGPVWAMVDDTRVTRVGRIIRKLRFDEIPQIINVLRGEMGLVGPRPERPYFVEKLKEEIPFYSQRHTIKPGVTGWAQICYPYGASKKDALEKLKYDLYYVKHMSLFFDLRIIFETAKIVLWGRGAR